MDENRGFHLRASLDLLRIVRGVVCMDEQCKIYLLHRGAWEQDIFSLFSFRVGEKKKSQNQEKKEAFPRMECEKKKGDQPPPTEKLGMG